MITIYNYVDYKEFLNDWLSSQPKKGRGLKKTFSVQMNCRESFVSQVLNGNSNFNLEQIYSIMGVLSLSANEKKYFRAMLIHNKAGTEKLRQECLEEMKELAKNSEELKDRFQVEDVLSEEKTQVYFSSWYFAAIHVLVTIDNYNTLKDISSRIPLSEEKIVDALDFLCECGLIKKCETGYTVAAKRLHLGRQSWILNKHHENWRLQAIRSLEYQTSEDLHYSSVISISTSSYKKIRNKILNLLKECKQEISDSDAEELYCFNYDLFRLFGN